MEPSFYVCKERLVRESEKFLKSVTCIISPRIPAVL